jgi:ATP-dependent RNA helicase DDX5/DBP2
VVDCLTPMLFRQSYLKSCLSKIGGSARNVSTFRQNWKQNESDVKSERSNPSEQPIEREIQGKKGNFTSLSAAERKQSIEKLGSSLTTPEWKLKGEIESYTKSVYTEHPEVSKLTESDVKKYFEENKVSIQHSGSITKPITDFQHCNFPAFIAHELDQSNFKQPTVIQGLSWPIALSGRNLIAVSNTGSGKTLSFLLPAFPHILAQPPLRAGDGPIVLVLAPTRELATQTQKECERFGRLSGMYSVAVFGGASRFHQAEQLKRGVEMMVATPGRLLDFLESGMVNLKRVTYLVLDEADRMLDMGFEPQVRKIVNQIRSDKQTLFYSATWPKEVEKLAADVVGNSNENVVKIVVGSAELQANPDVEQRVEFVPEPKKKERFLDWVKTEGKQKKCIVFVESKRSSDSLARELKYLNIPAESLHGDKQQRERDAILYSFKQGKYDILVCTDVAQRGLDIKNVDFVINYDLPNKIEDYVHRIGRTGRAGNKGISISYIDNTYVTPEKAQFAEDLCKAMKDVGQEPSKELEKFANLNKRRSRY